MDTLGIRITMIKEYVKLVHISGKQYNTVHFHLHNKDEYRFKQWSFPNSQRQLETKCKKWKQAEVKEVTSILDIPSPRKAQAFLTWAM